MPGFIRLSGCDILVISNLSATIIGRPCAGLKRDLNPKVWGEAQAGKTGNPLPYLGLQGCGPENVSGKVGKKYLVLRKGEGKGEAFY